MSDTASKVPQSIDAEMSLLGSILLEPLRVLSDSGNVVMPEMFSDGRHELIYRAMVKVHEEHSTLDLTTLNQRLSDSGDLDSVGGAAYLARLAQNVPTAANASHYARIIREKAELRSAIRASQETIHDIQHHADEPNAILLDRAEARLLAARAPDARGTMIRVGEATAEEYTRVCRLEDSGGGAIPTGFARIDALLGGLWPGEFCVLAARPSMGKTALAINVALKIAGRGVALVLFSLEMSNSAVSQRVMAALSGVDTAAIRSARLEQDQADRMFGTVSATASLPLHICDRSDLTLFQLRAQARRAVKRESVKVIIVDYLQLLACPEHGRETRQVEVAAISRGLKALAKELNVPVLALSQLNRASEVREGKRPHLSDLRDSGAIEQDADVVMLLHREGYYREREGAGQDDALAELIVAKNRNGPTGVIQLMWDAGTTSFEDDQA